MVSPRMPFTLEKKGAKSGIPPAHEKMIRYVSVYHSSNLVFSRQFRLSCPKSQKGWSIYILKALFTETCER